MPFDKSLCLHCLPFPSLIVRIGKDCAVCSEQHTAQLSFTCKDCSNSAGGIAVAVFLAAAALSVAVVVVLYVVSGEVGDKGHKVVGRLKRYVPLQSLKIVIVAWQILTQVRAKRGRRTHVLTSHNEIEVCFSADLRKM